MSQCDRCGQEDAECHCYLHEIAERVGSLEEELDDLTDIVKVLSDHIKRQGERGV